MKVQSLHLYHGAVLTQITEHASFKALNKVDDQYGHYLVNHNIRMFIKYLSKNTSAWHFSFTVSNLSAIREDLNSKAKLFLCLVCGEETICALDEIEMITLIDLESQELQYINIEVPDGGSMHVSGSAGDLEKTIKHNEFPDKLFEQA